MKIRSPNPYNYGIPNRSIHLYDFKDKERSVRYYGDYMLDRLQQAFHWEGLPDTIPQRNLELILQTCGHCIIAPHNGNYYALIGGYSGEPNVYYEPTQYIVANPALPDLKQLWTLNVDCVWIRNDTLQVGVNPLLSRYLSLLVENDISFRLANINTRLSMLISAQDDRTAKSARKYLSDLEAGELGIISSNAFFEGLQTENNTRGYSGTLKDLIEYHQYIRASMYNELGLDANYNMKRAFVNQAEIQANEDALFPLIDDMLEQRKIAVEIWNKLFDANISVELNSTWKNNKLEEQLTVKSIQSEIENLEADTENIVADTESILSDINEQETEDDSQVNQSRHPENLTSDITEQKAEGEYIGEGMESLEIKNDLEESIKEEQDNINELPNINIEIINNSILNDTVNETVDGEVLQNESTETES